MQSSVGTLHKTFDDSALVPADRRTTHEPAGCDPVNLGPPGPNRQTSESCVLWFQ